MEYSSESLAPLSISVSFPVNGVSRIHQGFPCKKEINMLFFVLQYSARAADNDISARATDAFPGNGSDVRRAILSAITAKGFALPLTYEHWVSMCSRECRFLQKEWMRSEKLDWRDSLQSVAHSAPASEKNFVALANGRIVGYYSSADDASDASYEEIAKTVGRIGVSITMQRHRTSDVTMESQGEQAVDLKFA